MAIGFRGKEQLTAGENGLILTRMKRCWLALTVLVLALGALVGCVDDDTGGNPFVGSWISATRGRITFDDSTWSDSDGDAGTYSYTGTHPVYRVTFLSGTVSSIERATFIDPMTLELCPILPDGTLGTCDELAIDRPTLH